MDCRYLKEEFVQDKPKQVSAQIFAVLFALVCAVKCEVTLP